MVFVPERDGWPLNKAIMRLSDAGALAAHAKVCALLEAGDGQRRLPRWWIDEEAPEVEAPEVSPSDLGRLASEQLRALENRLVERLTAGELIGWGRYNSPIDPHQAIPASAWTTLGRRPSTWAWRESSIAVKETTGQAVVTRNIRLPKILSRSSTPPWQPEVRTEQVLRPVQTVTLRLYAVRIEPPSENGAPGAVQASAHIVEWLSDVIRRRPDEPVPKASLWQDASKLGVSKRAFERAWGQATADHPNWRRSGRRPKSTR